MKKKIIISIVSIILIVVSLYFCNQYLNFKKYDRYGVTKETYENFINALNNEKTKNIIPQKLPENEYLKFGNIKIKNDFKDFKNDQGFTTKNNTRYMLRDKDGNFLAALSLGTTESRVETISNLSESYYKENSVITKKDVINFFKENNITNDIELFKFLKNQKNIQSNIFTNIHKIKNNYIISFIVTFMPEINEIIYINDNGYILNSDFCSEVNIIDGNKKYYLVFYQKDYFSDEYINNIINTLVIE